MLVSTLQKPQDAGPFGAVKQAFFKQNDVLMEWEGSPSPQRQKIIEPTDLERGILVIQRIQMVPPTFLALFIGLEMSDFLEVLRHFEGDLDPFDVSWPGSRQNQRPKLLLAITALKRLLSDLLMLNTLWFSASNCSFSQSRRSGSSAWPTGRTGTWGYRRTWMGRRRLWPASLGCSKCRS